MLQKYGLIHIELAFEQVDCWFMFDTLLLYLLNYGFVFGFGIPTRDENIVKVPDTFFHVFEDCINHFLK